MKQKLKPIFQFLNENRSYNKKLQESDYKSSILYQTDTKDKVISLLHNIVNTQSKPKIDSIAKFNKKINSNLEHLKSFRGFIELISSKNLTPSLESLYKGLRAQEGWGSKTSALFSKVVYQCHCGDYDKKLSFWDDCPKKINADEKFYLPVDTVIINIFEKISPNKKWNFNSINSVLRDNYTPEQIEIWDDLWFWGFIGQKSNGNSRDFLWNENKYWSLRWSDKNDQVILEIQRKTNQFIKILNEQTNT